MIKIDYSFCIQLIIYVCCTIICKEAQSQAVLQDTLIPYQYIKQADSLKGELKYKEAISAYKKAIDYYKIKNNKNKLAASYISLAKCHLADGNYKKCFEYANYTLGICDTNTKEEADAHYLIGLYYSINNENPSKALEFYKKSLTIREHIFPKYHADIAKSLYQIGYIYTCLLYTSPSPRDA